MLFFLNRVKRVVFQVKLTLKELLAKFEVRFTNFYFFPEIKKIYRIIRIKRNYK